MIYFLNMYVHQYNRTRIVLYINYFICLFLTHQINYSNILKYKVYILDYA